MKKILLFTTLCIFINSEIYSQSGNSCSDAIEITAGTYTVNGISGNTFESNCTEYDADNGELVMFHAGPEG